MGYGQAIAHATLFFVGQLSPVLEDATLYVDKCPHMSFWMALALSSLSMAMIHTAAMVVGFDGYSKASQTCDQERATSRLARWRRSLKQRNAMVAPGLTMIPTLVGLGNLGQDGCVAVIPIQLLSGIFASVYACYVACSRPTRSLQPSYQPLS